MKKLATLQYDVTDLVTAGQIDYLIDITKGKDELVKNAHIPSLEETEEIPDEQFALILYHPHIGKMKKLAMSDKYITELNMRIFEDRIESLPEEIIKVAAYHLSKAAKFYKITVPESIKKFVEDKPVSNWVNIAEVKPTHVKTAATDIKYALGNKYPIHTAPMVKKALTYFTDHWKRFSPLNAFEYAINVKTAADKLGVDYKGTRIEKYAHILPEKLNPLFKAAVAARKGYVAEENRPAFDELVKQANKLGPVKTAKVLESLDRELGLNREWNKSIEDPIFTVFATEIIKTAKHSGIEINLESLRKLPNGLVDDATMNDLKSDEGIDVYESLPSPVKTKLAKAMMKTSEKMETDLNGKGKGIVDKIIPTENKPSKTGNPTKDISTAKLLTAIDKGVNP
jgi:hypothetical protein